MIRHSLLVFALWILIIPTSTQDVVAQDILNHINTARNQMGLHDLSMNDQLIIAAQNHSDDMATGDFLNHVGSDGSQFWERMQAAEYGMSTGGENILLRWDVDSRGTFNQWWSSSPHRENMLNPAYIDIGIAFSQATSGAYYFTMVLGALPGVSPPPFIQRPTVTALPATDFPPTPMPNSPTQTPLPPASTSFSLATAIAPPTSFFVQPSPVLPTTSPLPSPTIVVEPDIRVAYSDSDFVLINIAGERVDLTGLTFESASGSMQVEDWRTEYLSQYLSDFTAADCMQVWIGATTNPPKPPNCRYRHSWIVAPEGSVFWQNVDSFIVRRGEAILTTCLILDGVCDFNLSVSIDSIFPTVTPVRSRSVADLRLVYSPESFSVINISAQALDVRGLSFQSTSGAMSIEKWDTEFLSQPLWNFSAGDCLHAWGLGTINVLSKPDDCDVRHSWIAVGEAFMFWRNTEWFTVNRDGVVLGSCRVSNEICDVSLSEPAGQSALPATALPTSPPANAPVAGVADIRLIYSFDSLALMNTSGHDLDLSALAFESDSGVMVASQWSTASMSRSLSAYPPGDCLQVWGAGETLQNKPVDCGYRHSWIAVSGDQQFWRGVASFRVRQGANLLVTCAVNADVCDVNLPEG